jgi:hypothetical protein
MRVRDMRNDAGVLTGFEVRNLLLSRARAARLAAGVTGARVTRWPGTLLFGEEAFAAFEVDGVPFLIIEPFGDNDRFWIVAETPSDGARPLIARVRATFEATPTWPQLPRWLTGR